MVPEETFEYPEGVWGLLKDILRFWIVFRSILDRYSSFNGSFSIRVGSFLDMWGTTLRNVDLKIA